MWYTYAEFIDFSNILSTFLIKDLINIIYNYYRLPTLNPETVYTNKYFIQAYDKYNIKYLMNRCDEKRTFSNTDLNIFEQNLKNKSFLEFYYFKDLYSYGHYVDGITGYELIITGKLSSDKYFYLEVCRSELSGINKNNTIDAYKLYTSKKLIELHNIDKFNIDSYIFRISD